MIAKLSASVRSWLWGPRPEIRLLAAVQRAGRYVFRIAGDLSDGQLNLRAMSLVYTTLLSIVPLLALAFSVLKALGVHNMLEPMLARVLAPLGPQADELTTQIIGFVDKIKVGVLGSLGVALLFSSALSLIQKVEGSFNYIWRVTRPRPLAQRLGEYFAVLMIGPVMVFAALGVTAAVFSSAFFTAVSSFEPFGFLFWLASKTLPYLLIIGAFAFMYVFVPNKRVKLRAALLGGCAAGLAWQTASVAFASFVASSTNNAIYAGFAIVIFLLIWIYVGWLILLVGCQLTYYLQHPHELRETKPKAALAGRQLEQIALLALILQSRRFIAGETAYTPEALTHALGAPPELVGEVLQILIDAGLVTESGGEKPRLLVARDPASISLAQLWRVARDGHGRSTFDMDQESRDVLGLIERAEREFESTLGGLTLRDWVAGKRPAAD